MATGVIPKNGGAVVVNIGAGLDSTFQRVDPGTVRWINIDLPDVVAMRQKLIRQIKIVALFRYYNMIHVQH